MDVNGGRCSSSNNTIIANESSEEEEDQMMRRGPWTVEEDVTLMNYISIHGEGRWNSLARCAGLKRTGKSCRLRWLNYLRPDVLRGNITLEEQLLILQLHFRWGNRWSKIAQHLPGRTDNEIKNYWRTRVQKHAKQLKCDVNSKQFKDTMRYLWMPMLVERIQASQYSSFDPHHFNSNNINNNIHVPAMCGTTSIGSDQYGGVAVPQVNNSISNDLQNSMTSAVPSSDSFGPHFSPISDLTDNYNNFPVCYNTNPDYFQASVQVGYTDTLITPFGYYNNDSQAMEQNNQWLVDGGSGDVSDNLWNVEGNCFLQQQFTNNM